MSHAIFINKNKNQMDFEGKSVIISGCVRDFGSLLALNIAEKGAEQIIYIDNDEKALCQLENDIKKFNTEFYKMVKNVTEPYDATDVFAFIQKAAKEGVDIFINISSFLSKDLLGESLENSSSNFSKQYNTEFTNVVDLTNQISKIMSPDGSIVFVLPPYNADTTSISCAKSSLEMFTKTAALDLGRKAKIRVNSVRVGFVDQTAKENKPDKKFVQAEHIKNVTMFLACDLSRDITGTIQVVDNGYKL